MKNKEKNSNKDSLALRVIVKAIKLICASVLLATFQGVSTSLALADDEPALMPPAPGWACWVSDDDLIGIYCIHDLMTFKQIESLDPDDDELESALLAIIYEKIFTGKTAGLTDFVREHINDLYQDSLWVIDLWSYPSRDSWEEDMPARLVRAGLCPRTPSCPVILSR